MCSYLLLPQVDGHDGADAETLEAQEARLVASYEAAVSHAVAGEEDRAREELWRLLEDPLLKRAHAVMATKGVRGGDAATLRPQLDHGAGPTSAAPGSSSLAKPQPQSMFLKLRFLALKGLAELEEGGSEEALDRYHEASQLGVEDAVVWHRLADTAFSRGQHTLARRALESGLDLRPGNPVMMEKLTLVRRCMLASYHSLRQQFFFVYLPVFLLTSLTPACARPKLSWFSGDVIEAAFAARQLLVSDPTNGAASRVLSMATEVLPEWDWLAGQARHGVSSEEARTAYGRG